MAMFRNLADISLGDLTTYGGKAARLGEALRLGCPVLPGVALSTDLYRRFMQQGGLQGEIASILSTLQPSALAQFQAAEWAIRSAFQVRRLPNEVSDAIHAAWAAMGAIPLAVRSSAIREDSPEHSFVGQHESFLDVEGEENVIQAVLGCWMSLFSAKALAYGQRFGVDLVRSAMAVILQPMIRRSAHGALFNVDPITGDPDIFMLEVKEGPQAGIYKLRPYERSPGESPYWTQLRYYGLMLGEAQLAYQGIEWAIAEDQMYLMRVRPLTSVPPYLPIASTDVGATGRQLRLNRPEGCQPRALRPYSWYHRSLSAKLNAASVREANRLFSAHMEREEYYVCGYLYLWSHYARLPAYDAEINSLRRFFHSLRRLYAARTLDRPYQALWRRAQPVLAELAEIDLSTLSKRELHARLSQMIDLEEAFWVERGRLGDCDQALADLFRRLFTRWIGDDPETCELLMRREGEQLARCHRELCELAQVAYATPEEESRAFAGFFRRHRQLFVPKDHLTNLADIRQIRANQDQARALWERLKSESEAETFCAERAKRDQRREAAQRQMLRRLGPLRGAILSYVLERGRHYAPLSMDRDTAILAFRLMQRDIVLEAGRRLHVEGLIGERQDAFLLGHLEILSWLEDTQPRDAIVRACLERKERERQWWRYAPPDILQDRSSTAKDTSDAVQYEEVLTGQPISAGVASGRARLINSLGEATNVRPGDVLVCREPLFELTPLFDLACAVVTETGSLLDHAGVLAREYGIPAVFGVPNITQMIRDDDELQVDGREGTVARRAPQPEWNVL